MSVAADAIVGLAEAAMSISPIEPACEVLLERAGLTVGLSEIDQKFYQHMEEHVFAARIAKVDEVSLCRLPHASLLMGGGDFVVVAAGKILREQVPPHFKNDNGKLTAALGDSMPVVDVACESLLLARFGIGTWGHWLCELLPKAIIIERKFPKRFKFVVPQQVCDNGNQIARWRSVRSSLLAANIGLDRLLPLDQNKTYSFASLYCVSPVWSDHIMHPGVSQSVRDCYDGIPPSSNRCIALVRDPHSGREIENTSEVYELADSLGFACVEAGSLPFTEQVSIFRGAERLLGVLGSDFANLLFSPPGVRVLTMAPGNFGDRFFYALVLDRKGGLVDFRGPVTKLGQVWHKSTFKVDTSVLRSCIAHFDD